VIEVTVIPPDASELFCYISFDWTICFTYFAVKVVFYYFSYYVLDVDEVPRLCCLILRFLTYGGVLIKSMSLVSYRSVTTLKV
jgi:hypothetical protein